VAAFRKHYAANKTVETALERSRRYMQYIIPEFRKRRLPLQLAYLPMLESMFDPRADSGNARGMWQFIPSTAKHMGLSVGIMGDERLNVQKSTAAAADYLDQLGEMFNYNWALALAAYNCGPGCVRDAMKRQRSWDFWELRLRQETHEYVPRFLAMLQVAQTKYPHLMALEGAPSDEALASGTPEDAPSGDAAEPSAATAPARTMGAWPGGRAAAPHDRLL
jgi:membrane-bound lytic murein transglycosylase D